MARLPLLTVLLFAAACDAGPPPAKAATTAPAPAPTPTPAPAPAPAPAPVATHGAAHDNLQAVAWFQTSAEFEASALGTYNAATLSLDRALADKKWTALGEQEGQTFAKLPPAVIVDVDETVLDNSAYQARLIAEGGEFAPKTWGAWVGEARAVAIPGAKEFLTTAAKKGVRVFYVSNRDAGEQAEATRKNLAALGFPDSDNLDTFYFRDESKGWKQKSPRRLEVAKKYRVVIVVGDNLFDFVEDVKPARERRAAMVTDRSAWWGTRWFMLANPMYGSWDEALIAYDYKQAPSERQRLRLAALDTLR
jgi:5'-nucleotidase (lipoprotein e(P4) family)